MLNPPKFAPMRLTSDIKFKKLVVIGGRVLIRPSRPHERTDSGLYLPPGVQEKEKVQQDYVIKTGAGRRYCHFDAGAGGRVMTGGFPARFPLSLSAIVESSISNGRKF